MRWYQNIEAVLYIANASTSRTVDIYALVHRIGCFSERDFWGQAARCICYGDKIFPSSIVYTFNNGFFRIARLSCMAEETSCIPHENLCPRPGTCLPRSWHWNHRFHLGKEQSRLRL